MLIRDALLPEFDHETANTRRLLERVPMEKGDWKPHPKSAALAALATHVATIPGWIKPTIQQDSIDLANAAPPPPATTREELLALFDRSVAEGRAALAAADNDALMQPWSLRSGDQVFFTMPKAAVLRSFVMNHSVHHRAQLGVYLRLNDVPIPGMYGPSADEPMF
jgi:uncharacterized damage-inducible protein DinB